MLRGSRGRPRTHRPTCPRPMCRRRRDVPRWAKALRPEHFRAGNLAACGIAPLGDRRGASSSPAATMDRAEEELPVVVDVRARAGLVLGGLLLAPALNSAPAHAHRGLHSAPARRACSQRELGEACSWTDARQARYIGTCREVSTSLLCVRNRPIERSGSDAAVVAERGPVEHHAVAGLGSGEPEHSHPPPGEPGHAAVGSHKHGPPIVIELRCTGGDCWENIGAMGSAGLLLVGLLWRFGRRRWRTSAGL